MKMPDHTSAIYWHCGGDIIAAHARPDGRPDALTGAQVEERMELHKADLKEAALAGSYAAERYHAAHVAQLNKSVRQQSAHLRAGRLFMHGEG